MITCPKCNNSLPDWTQTCQFCQTDVKKVARPVQDPQMRRVYQSLETPTWVWVAYYIIAGYFILSGGYDLISGIMTLVDPPKQSGFIDPSAEATISLIVGIVGVVIGLGLAFRVELIRAITNFFCYLKLLMGILGVVGSLGVIALLGFWGLIAFFFAALDVVTAGFMIYLLGETESRAPNL